ncbi:hypothetical protein FSP39_009965 [Pinctada imbricata]|uniref:Metaxin-2 n=1 Tax=Pinctada imbricata TaxID=66713 RepID=A0AA88XII2_PINIB|nr:hypothetical protein FSP39_009965 [Pinctada imbricata]
MDIYRCDQYYAHSERKSFRYGDFYVNISATSQMFTGVKAATKRFEATERWPDDVQLVQTFEAEQIILPDYANCLSVRAFLKMCKLPFSRDPRTNAEEMSPSGYLPFIKAGSFLVAGFDPIVGFVKRRGFDLSSSLSPTQQSELQAYIAMVHNILDNVETTRPRYGSIHPWPLNWIIPLIKQREIKSKLDSIGWCKKTEEEVDEEVRSCCQALSERLGDQDYFFGDQPTELDALVFGHLFALLTTELPDVSTPTIIRKFPNLLDFVKLVEEKYFREIDEE